VRLGEAVAMRIRLINNSGQSETLRFPSGKRYDFWVVDADGGEVWRWSEDRMFTQAVEEDELAGQAGVSYSEAWQPSETGEYVVHGELTAEGYEGPFTVEVRVE
jgi:hypothetical protein